MGNYDDILYREHPVSEKYPQMSMEQRAAQFSPFAALTGYGDEIEETGRLTTKERQLDDNEKARLDRIFHQIIHDRDRKPEIQITYFEHDTRKAGGAYITKTGTVRKIDEYQRCLLLDDEDWIALDRIIDIVLEKGE